MIHLVSININHIYFYYSSANVSEGESSDSQRSSTGKDFEMLDPDEEMEE